MSLGNHELKANKEIPEEKTCNSQAYLGPYQTTMTERLAKRVYAFYQLTIFTKRSI